MRVGPRGLPPTGCAWGRFPRGDATSPQTEFLAKRGRLPASAPGNPREAVGGTTLNSFPFFLLFFVPFYSHCCQEYVLPFFAAPPLASSRPAPLHRLQTRLRFVQSRGGPAFPRREKRALPVCAGKAKLKKRNKRESDTTGRASRLKRKRIEWVHFVSCSVSFASFHFFVLIQLIRASFFLFIFLALFLLFHVCVRWKGAG